MVQGYLGIEMPEEVDDGPPPPGFGIDTMPFEDFQAFLLKQKMN